MRPGWARGRRAQTRPTIRSPRSSGSPGGRRPPSLTTYGRCPPNRRALQPSTVRVSSEGRMGNIFYGSNGYLATGDEGASGYAIGWAKRRSQARTEMPAETTSPTSSAGFEGVSLIGKSVNKSRSGSGELWKRRGLHAFDHSVKRSAPHLRCVKQFIAFQRRKRGSGQSDIPLLTQPYPLI